MQNCAHNEEHDRIMDFIDRILALTPQSADEWENQAFIYTILGEPKKAISCLKKAIELKPKGWLIMKSQEISFQKLENTQQY